MSVDSVWAKTSAEIQESIQAQMFDRHPDENLDVWRKLGSEASSIAIQMFEETDRVDHRMKLIYGLGAFDTPATGEFLKRQAQDSDSQDVIQYAAIRSLGESQGAKEADFIAKFLKSEDPQARLAAAETLKKMNHPKADAILDQYKTEEKTPWLLARLEGRFPRPGVVKKPQVSQLGKPADLGGEWRGFLLTPKPDSNQGMVSEAVLLSLQTLASNQVTGTVTFKKKKGIKKFVIQQGAISSSQLSGELLESGPSSKASPIPSVIQFKGDVLTLEKSRLIELRIPKWDGILVVRKDPVL
jgi:hypothetical protein